MSINDSSNQLFPLVLRDRAARAAVGGFLLSGLMLGLLGSIMVAWRYYLEPDSRWIGAHFLALNGGCILAGWASQKLLKVFSVRWVLVLSCFLMVASLVGLIFAVPPVEMQWRLGCLFLGGLAAGSLTSTLFYAIRPYYEENAAATINFAGVVFGLGSLLATVIIGIANYAVSPLWRIVPIAIFPLVYLFIYLPHKRPAYAASPVSPLKHAASEFRSPAAILFSLLLFFQFGSEWCLAGWLPIYLIRQLPASPDQAIFALALFFLSLILGRFVAQFLLPNVNHAKLLIGSVSCALLGYLVLSFTNTYFGALAAIIVIGAGFSSIYPLTTERIRGRFPYYHPGFYSGIFSFAVTGGMSAPWFLGFVDYYFGLSFMMLIPALGSLAVFLIALLLMLEAKLTVPNSETHTPKPPIPSLE